MENNEENLKDIAKYDVEYGTLLEMYDAMEDELNKMQENLKIMDKNLENITSSEGE